MKNTEHGDGATQQVEQKLLKKTELAAALNLSTRTIEGLMARGSIPHIKFRRAVRFDLNDVMRSLKTIHQVGAVHGEVNHG